MGPFIDYPDLQRETEQADNQVNPLEDITTLAPGGGQVAVPNIQQYVGIFNAFRKFYLDPDVAIQASRENARRMRLDPAIMGPLDARRLATAQLPGEVQPENALDPYQVWVAQEIQSIIDEIPYFIKYKYVLMDAIFYGSTAINNVYDWDFSRGYKRLKMREWWPIHPDTLTFKWDTDAIGVYIGANSNMGKGTKTVSAEAAQISRAHVFTPFEREAVTFHQHIIEAADFLNPTAAGLIRKGLGIRSVIYWYWWVKNEVLGALQTFVQRVGTGITVYYFTRGSQASYDAVRQIAESASQDLVCLWPRDPDEPHSGAEGVERIEPSTAAVENLRVLIDTYEKAIKLYILGQELTSESHATGLGSGVADAHENTFTRLVRFDAANLGETITREIVWIIQKHVFPDCDFKCRYIINVDRPDPDRLLGAVSMFVQMGGTVDEDEVRSLIGLKKPTGQSRVLGGMMALNNAQQAGEEEREEEEEGTEEE